MFNERMSSFFFFKSYYNEATIKILEFTKRRHNFLGLSRNGLMFIINIAYHCGLSLSIFEILEKKKTKMIFLGRL